ncbi:MAG: hypothetical protein Q7R39_10010 [Dehalococcoidia bacterium]|nr:hypothetical protein [Dehalococcoidia bacterium]
MTRADRQAGVAAVPGLSEPVSLAEADELTIGEPQTPQNLEAVEMA